ncbi:MAG: hypothetical protein AAFQ37_03740, partial [Bacteroidota bacterium]
MRKIAFEIEINGIRQTINNTDQLSTAVKELNAEYRKADFGSDERAKLQKDLGTLKTLQREERQRVRDLGREYEITRDRGQGSYRAINAELVNLRRRYKEISAEERDTFGPQLLRRIQNLDQELKQIDASLGQYQRNVGNYSEGIV